MSEFEAYLEEMLLANNRCETIHLVLGVPETVAICGLMQLALRHPDVRWCAAAPGNEKGKGSVEVADQMIRSIADDLRRRGYPLISEIIMRGFEKVT